MYYLTGCAANVPDLWAYFVLDQILPISFTQNLFCLALTQTTNVSFEIHTANHDHHFILCLRLVGLLCYLVALYWIPSMLNTAQFFPILFTLRILLFTPYLVDRLARHLRNTTSSTSNLTTENFHKLLVAISVVAFAHTAFSEPAVYANLRTISMDTNYAVAALSHDMLIGFVSVVSLLLLFRKQSTRSH